MKKINLLFPALLATLLLASCGGKSDTTSTDTITDSITDTNTDTNTDSDTDPEPLPKEKVAHGTGALFTEYEGYSSFDAKVIEEDDARYVVYMSNETQEVDVNSIYVRKGTKVDGKWVYEQKTLALKASESGWDKKITAPSVVKGVFRLGSETYNYLMAYQANDNNSDDNCYSIGLAYAKDMLGEWTKVEKPLLECKDTSIYGYGSPELISCNENGVVGITYTWGEATLTCTSFQQFDATDLSKIVVNPGYVQIASKGLIDGQATPIFANAGFAFKYNNPTIYTVRDIYPLSSVEPGHSNKIEVSKAPFEILETAENSWTSVKTITGSDTIDENDESSLGWDELYSASFVTNAYGYIAQDATSLEVVYTGADEQGTYETDYRFSSFVCSITVSL